MSPELDEALVKDFPYLYADRHKSLRETGMYWGFSVADGWEPLIRKLSEKIEPIAKSMAESDSESDYPKACQVKEKFGTLRFYMTQSTEEINKFIREAEIKSASVCEVCGESGTRREGAWVKTLCDEHAKERYR
jgi:formylmethanofuran dehydrogenase subunit E